MRLLPMSVWMLSLVVACGGSQLKELSDSGSEDSSTIVRDTGVVIADSAAMAADTALLAKDASADVAMISRDTGVVKTDVAMISRDTGVVNVDTAMISRDTAVPTDGPGCFMGGRSYAVGETFPSIDGCNTCTCMASGAACTARACLVDAAAPGCPLSTTLTLWYDGGMRIYTEQAVIKDVALTFTRSYQLAVDGGAIRTCAPALPKCGSAGQIDLGDIAADYASPDVAAAFALPDPTVFGVDPRAYDGTVFAIKNGAGKTIYVGADCPSPTSSSCRPVPAGVKTLATDLKTMFEAAKAAPACVGL